MSLVSYLKSFEVVLPPWLLRTEALKLIGSIADVMDDHRDMVIAAVKLRFPGLYTLEGIDKTGAERKIRRGPAESADVYADRLKRWWIDHRESGNGPTLLEQMLAYLVGTLDPPYDVVSYLGVRHVMDANEEITRDKITWGTDQTGFWARVWVFLYDPNTGPATADAMEVYAAIVRDWVPGHTKAKVVVIHPDTRLWDYPQPAPTWDEGWDWDGGPTIKDV